jgi:hypothetical protein
MNTPIDQAIDAVLEPIEGVKPPESGMPYATHKGVLELVPGLRMNCYRLNTGQSVIDEEGMRAFLEFLGIEAKPTTEAAHG